SLRSPEGRVGYLQGGLACPQAASRRGRRCRAARAGVPGAGRPSAARQGDWGLLVSEKIRVAVIDPYPLFRQGMIQTIAQSRQLAVVAEGATLGEAERVVRDQDPDVLIFDLGLPDAGADGVPEFIKRGPACKLVVLTSADDVASVAKALAAGVQGYIL